MNSSEETSLQTQTNPPPIEAKPEKDLVRVAKAESINHLLAEGYKKASTLLLTPEESEALGADFSDECFRLGAGGDMNLLYIEHAHLRKRINDVLGLGAAVAARRREWADEAEKKDKNGKFQKVVTVYVDCVLLVRGCMVAEAVGDMTYFPNNGRQTYADALEGAESFAFRRCAKEFGIGLQPYMKSFVDAWKARNPGKGQQTPRREYDQSPREEYIPSSGSTTSQQSAPPEDTSAGLSLNNCRTVKVHWGTNRDKELGSLTPRDLQYYAEKWVPNGHNGAKPSAQDVRLKTAAQILFQESIEATERE